jgi:hypothetical protein
VSALSRLPRPRNLRAKAPEPSAPTAPPAKPKEPGAGPDAELLAQRERLIERFTIMQADLGGAFYEMAIRDHVRLDALTARAAELQVVDAELAQVERSIELQATGIAGRCPTCDAPHGSGVAFCSQCGHPLIQVEREPAATPAATNGVAP